MQTATYVVFAGFRRVAAGDRAGVLRGAKAFFDKHEEESLLCFEDRLGQQLELDLSGSLDDVLARELRDERPAARGRPKLGVVSREVTLLPRHWEWLEEQPNGLSAALRRLVEEAMKRSPGKEEARRLRDGLSRFLSAAAGNLPRYEEATRALFSGDHEALRKHTTKWPADLRRYVHERVAVIAACEADC